MRKLSVANATYKQIFATRVFTWPLSYEIICPKVDLDVVEMIQACPKSVNLKASHTIFEEELTLKK